MTQESEHLADPQQLIRRANLKRLYAIHGGPTRLAELLGLANGSYLSQMASGTRPIRDRWARKIEDTLRLPRGWMDTDHSDAPLFAPPTASPNTPTAAATAAATEDLTTHTVLAVSAALGDIRVSPTTLATLVSLVLEHSRMVGGVDDTYLRKLISLVGAGDKAPA
ncbi:hypothetical protein [Ralstonia mannitolilytica]|uniref:hypothetical protein n=1 Tax=Ralstonia mannitolilytica TaxID=105219 RepID=UPI0007B022DB|nr:hypothetical protein [Ralstonia mannitolilytica]ANA34307.1 hypothetical protein VZ52_13385 [Ralstonia mannitolilytica]